MVQALYGVDRSEDGGLAAIVDVSAGCRGRSEHVGL